MIRISDVLTAYSKRDEASRAEQTLEDQIFDTRQRTHEEAEILAKEYRRLKDKRAQASIDAAVLYMQLSPADKKKVTEQWAKSREGTRKTKGTRIRGVQPKADKHAKKEIDI